MRYSVMHFLLVGMLLPLTSAVTNGGDSLTCLPDGIKLDTVITSEHVKSARGESTKTVTAGETLIKLKARCKAGKLVDGDGREIRFYRLVGCWGNPPEDYQEILQRQREELSQLKKKYTVIEIPCGQEDPRTIS